MKKKKNIVNCAILLAVIVVVLFSVYRICASTIQDVAASISGSVDNYIHMVDDCILELEINAPIESPTGFSFRFEGEREYFENASFMITAAIINEPTNPQVLYENKIALTEIAYDYQKGNYIVIIPFEGNIQRNDRLCITISGTGILEEADVLVESSSRISDKSITFSVDGFEENSILSGMFYYQTRGLKAFPILVQGIVIILLVILAGELFKKKIAEDKNVKIIEKIKPASMKKRIFKLVPVVVLLVVVLDYTNYASMRLQLWDAESLYKMHILFFVLCVFIVGLTLILFWYAQNRLSLERLLFFSIVFLGILFELVVTPFAVPDEITHVDTVYRISNQMLGKDDTGIRDAIYKRDCDIYADGWTKVNISKETYQWLYDDWFHTEGNRTEQLVFAADNNRGNFNTLFFLPAAICVTVARILGIGFIPMIFLIRTVNLLLAAGLIYLAVKKLPFGKSVLCMIALLPITVQQLAACSYDALIIPISMLYVSYCVFAIYSQSRLERTDVLIIIITAIMLGICKGGVYTPLYLLMIWIMIKKGYFGFLQTKGVKIAGIVLVVGVLIASIIGWLYIYRLPEDSLLPQNEGLSLLFLLRYPFHTMRIIENSLYKDTYEHFQHFFGGCLGSTQLSTKFIVPIGYMILLGRSVLNSEKYPYIPNISDKCVFMISAGLSFAAVHAAFLLEMTYFISNSIRGIQGRYYLPVLWLFLICFRTGNVIDKNKKYAEMILAGYLLGVCTVLQIVIGAVNPNL